MAAKKKIVEIPEAKIRSVIWMLKKKKTKKACCDHLGIAYNTKRLDTIIKEFQEKEQRIKELKAKAVKAPITENMIKDIVSSYLENEAMSKIGERHYISGPRVKKVLIEQGIPIRGKGKKAPAQTSHIIEDYDTPFVIGEKVYIPGHPEEEFININKAKIQLSNLYGLIKKIYDENYIEHISNGYRKAIYNPHVKVPKDEEPKEGIHYNVYWYLEDGTQWGLANAFQHYYTRLENMLVETGRESYEVWIDDKGFYTIRREDMLKLPA